MPALQKTVGKDPRDEEIDAEKLHCSDHLLAASPVSLNDEDALYGEKTRPAQLPDHDYPLWLMITAKLASVPVTKNRTHLLKGGPRPAEDPLAPRKEPHSEKNAKASTTPSSVDEVPSTERRPPDLLTPLDFMFWNPSEIAKNPLAVFDELAVRNAEAFQTFLEVKEHMNKELEGLGKMREKVEKTLARGIREGRDGGVREVRGRLPDAWGLNDEEDRGLDDEKHKDFSGAFTREWFDTTASTIVALRDRFLKWEQDLLNKSVGDSLTEFVATTYSFTLQGLR